VLLAVWTLNRRAKRCRDLAQKYYVYGRHGFAGKMREEKERLYYLKSQALHWLVVEGRLQVTGNHTFAGKHGKLWSEVLQGGGYIFHRPCPQSNAPVPTVNASPPTEENQVGAKLFTDLIEAKPKETSEARLEDAYHTVDVYLRRKPSVEVYEWPTPAKSREEIRA